jgi:hypothetical protein
VQPNPHLSGAQPNERSPERPTHPCSSNGNGQKHAGSRADAGRGRVARRAQAFRALPVALVGRVHDGALVFDLRCLDDEPRLLERLGAGLAV